MISPRNRIWEAEGTTESGYLLENITAYAYLILLNLVAPLGLIQGFT